ELANAADTVELVAGLYDVAVPALAAAYRRHLAETNPLVDQPTTRLLRVALIELDDAIEWGRRASDVLPDASGAGEWRAHLRALLAAAGGVAGDDVRPAAATPKSREPRRPSVVPARDERFKESDNFDF